MISELQTSHEVPTIYVGQAIDQVRGLKQDYIRISKDCEDEDILQYKRNYAGRIRQITRDFIGNSNLSQLPRFMPIEGKVTYDVFREGFLEAEDANLVYHPRHQDEMYLRYGENLIYTTAIGMKFQPNHDHVGFQGGLPSVQIRMLPGKRDGFMLKMFQ